MQNFSPIAQTVYEICITNFFHFLAPGGLTPGLKFIKRGDDLADSEIYHPAKFHRSMSTHARDIRYQKSCGHTHTHKQTVNDISTTCLSACVDNKTNTSMPVIRTGVDPDMPIAVTANSLQHWLSPSKWWRVAHTTYGPQLSYKFVAPGYRLLNVLSICQFLTWGLIPGPKVTEREDDLLSA